MPSLPTWARGRKSYIEAMESQLNAHNSEYGFSMLKYMYSATYRFELALNDPEGIDPKEIEWCLSNLEHHIEELREWQHMKYRESRGLSAIA